MDETVHSSNLCCGSPSKQAPTEMKQMEREGEHKPNDNQAEKSMMHHQIKTFQPIAAPRSALPSTTTHVLSEHLRVGRDHSVLIIPEGAFLPAWTTTFQVNEN